MKKLIAISLALIISITMITGCGGVAKEPVGDSVSDSDIETGLEDEGSIETYITYREAREALQTWVDGHPFQFVSELEPESDDNHIVDGMEYYRFFLGIIRLGVIEILVDKETGEFFHFNSPGNNTIEPLDDWYERERAEYEAVSFLTAEEARRNLQLWLNEHPIEPSAVLASEYDEYMDGADGYYLFSIDDSERYWLNFLVHKETSELLFMMISDGEEEYIEIEPIEDWYKRYYE
jgi:hypothetical protein